jgi:hypothetical protein
VSKNCGLPLAGFIFCVVLAPGSAQAVTGPLTKNCPAEPTQHVPISSGLTYSGPNCVISTTGDLDGFQFTAAAGDTWRVVVALGPSASTNVCLALLGPGVPPPQIFSGCSSINYPNFANSAETTKTLTAAGTYTINVTEQNNAVISYALSLERINPLPSDAIPLKLSQNVSDAVSTIAAQDAYTFHGATTGEYQITASVPSGASSNICFDIFQGATSVVSGSCTSINYPNFRNTTQYLVVPQTTGTFLVLVYVSGNDGTQNYNLEVACYAGTCPPTPQKCALGDSLSYSSGTLTMDFNVGTPVAATWNIWLTYDSTMQSIYSDPLPVTVPEMLSKTWSVPPAGVVGVLSTLTTPTSGIMCSSWNVINTGQ